MEERNSEIPKQNNKFLSKAAISFGVWFLVLLTAWYFLYEVVIKPNDFYDKHVIATIASQGQWFLEFLGYSTLLFDYSGNGFSDFVQIQGSPGVIIGAGCDGLVIIALFIIFISLFAGPVRHKLWFIPLGILLIHSLNVLRVAILAIIVLYRPEWLAFNHDYTFVLITYGFVFLLWMIWVNKFSQTVAK
ncbi:MAG: exosortase X [Flavobacteriales bacterium]